MAAQVSTTAWYSDPDFVAARNRTIPPGGLTFYSSALYPMASRSEQRTEKLTNVHR